MANSFHPARDVAKPRIAGGIWLDHAVISESDYSWLQGVERLTLWNVKLPSGFLGRLDKLWWLDLRGGSAADLSAAMGASKLKYLAVNQVRGLTDLSLVPELRQLQFLSLYGLAKVAVLPSLAQLSNLKRVELGQMKGLSSIGPALEAPALEEIKLLKIVPVAQDDIPLLKSHPALKRFDWSFEDVPRWMYEPVTQAITLPRARAMHPEEWFGLKDDA